MYRLKVREVAAKKKVSQRKIFLRSGVDIKILQKIYRDPSETNITMETLDRIAKVLEVDVSELIESIPEGRTPE